MTDAIPPNPNQRADEAESIVRRYLASFQTRDPETIASFVAEDFVNEHTAGLGTGCRGREIYRQRLTGFLYEMVDLTYDIEHLVSYENEVAAFYVMRATWRGTTPFSLPGAQLLVLHDGLITHRTDYWDSAVFLSRVDSEARTILSTLGVTDPAEDS